VGRLLRAELLRAASGRTLTTLATIAVVLNALAVVGNGSSKIDALQAGQMSAAAVSHELLGLGFGALLFATLFGAFLTTGEFRHGSIARSLTLSRRCERLMSAKAGAAVVAGLLFGVLGAGSALVTTAIVMSANDASLVLDRESVLVLTGVVAVCVLSALWGTLLGWIVRAQLPTLIGIMAWTLIAEGAIISLAPEVGRFLPGGAQSSIVRDFDTGDPLSTPLGYLLFAGWIAAACALAVSLMRRRDVT
jgi:ABC-2 type transport system permease protein